MKRILFKKSLAVLCVAGLFAACGEPEEDPDNQDNQNQENHNQENHNDHQVDHPFEDCTTSFEAQDDPEDNRVAIVNALVEAEPGDILCFNDGTYELHSELQIRTDNLEIRGQSRDGVILDFTNQDDGSNGLDGQDVSDLQIRSLTVLNTPGNGIEVRRGDGLVFDDLAVLWESENDPDNGDYGIYPVNSENVIIENSLVVGASDAGIYLGQSVHGVIRNNETHGNVASIEIENSSYIDVYGNHAHDNTGGILAFNLVGLDRKRGDNVRIFDNLVENNNRENFAGGSGIIRLVPSGTGVLVIGMQKVEVFDNDIIDHRSVGIAALTYDSLDLFLDDYDPEDGYYMYAEQIFVHDNTIDDAGYSPRGVATQIVDIDPIPAILWDGVINEEKAAEEPEEEWRNCFLDNVDSDGNPVTYANVSEDDENPVDPGDNECTGFSPEPVDL